MAETQISPNHSTKLSYLPVQPGVNEYFEIEQEKTKDTSDSNRTPL